MKNIKIIGHCNLGSKLCFFIYGLKAKLDILLVTKSIIFLHFNQLLNQEW